MIVKLDYSTGKSLKHSNMFGYCISTYRNAKALVTNQLHILDITSILQFAILQFALRSDSGFKTLTTLISRFGNSKIMNRTEKQLFIISAEHIQHKQFNAFKEEDHQLAVIK